MHAIRDVAGMLGSGFETLRSAPGMIERHRLWVAAATMLVLSACHHGGSSSNPPAPMPGPNITVSGTVSFDFVPAVTGVGLDYANTQSKPARGVTVQVLNNSSLLATTTTDDAGAYSVSVASNLPLIVRARAEMVRAGAGGWNVRVSDNTQGDALYVADTLSFTPQTDTTRDVHAASGWGGSSYTATRSAAPFAILDTIYDAMQFVLASEPTLSFPPLVVHWSTNNKPTTGAVDVTTGNLGSSFYDSGTGIYLLGAENDDTDEYDRSVIDHEWGHYLTDSFARDDSEGGPHTRNDQLDLRVAFGEGLANAFAGMFSGDSVYRDVSGDQQAHGFSFNLEGPLAFQAQNQYPGWFSEESIQELVYDFYDTNADPVPSAVPVAQDNVALGFAPIFAALTGPVKNSLALTSIFPFVNGLQTAEPQAQTDIEALVNAENLDTIVDDFGSTETHFGTPATSDLTTIYNSLTVTAPNAPVPTNVCSLDDFKSASTGSVDKLGSRRYLRFTAPTAGVYTLKATAVGPLNDAADPDLVLHQAGEIARSEGPPSNSCQTSGTTTPSLCNESFTASLSPGDYILEVYEWTNTTDDPSYPPIGRTCFDVTVTQP